MFFKYIYLKSVVNPRQICATDSNIRKICCNFFWECTMFRILQQYKCIKFYVQKNKLEDIKIDIKQDVLCHYSSLGSWEYVVQGII